VLSKFSLLVRSKFVDGLPDEHSSALFRQVLDASYDSIIITLADLDRPEIVYVNPAFCRMTGYAPGEVIGKTPKMLQGPETDHHVTGRLKEKLDSGESYEAHAINYRKDGTPFHLQWLTSPVFDENGVATHYMAIQRDITDQVHMIERLRQEARIDGLTGLLNRDAGQAALTGLIDRAGDDDTPLSLVLFDIDHFKAINDTEGHVVGDYVLRHVAKIIDGRTRGDDLVIRWGGEEFVVALWDTAGDGAVTAAEFIRQAVEVAAIENLDSVTLSGGVAEWRPGQSMLELIEEADRCLYEAKSSGRNRIVS